jgi:ParB-like chromosome segregation protein Spo0J
MTESIPLWNIRPSRFQPRAPQFDAEKLLELAQSIKENGLINPVMVFTYDDADGYMVWELIAGERRSRACASLTLAELFPQHTLADWCARLAHVGLTGMGDEERDALRKGQAHIPATVHPGNDLQAIHQIAVIENLDRDDLNPLEEARAFQGLVEAYGWSQRELAARVNKSQGYVAQRLGLLNLNEVAAEALNTRVIGMSHARALAAMPETLQAAATEYVVAEVKKDESPATTRQIENQLRALTAFVNPARWEHGERIYTPQARNRLEVIQMLVSGPHAEERIAKGWGHLRIYNDGYETKNLLTAKPVTIVENDRLYSAVTNALGMQPQDAWQNHAHLLNKWCSTCIFGEKWRPQTPGLSAHCPRWRKGCETMDTCEGWIGAFGPVVIPVREWSVRKMLGEALFEDSYTNSLEAYLAAYEAATNKLIEEQAQKEEKATNGPRLQIAEYWAWLEALPVSSRTHSQAHNCTLCRYYEPMNGDAPCRFALNPLNDNWRGPQAPQMGVLYGPALQALPRCEMFTRVTMPGNIYQQPGFSIARGARGNLLNWMRVIRGSSGANLGYWARTFLWRGLFAWLCPNGKNGSGYSWDDITTRLAKDWDLIGNGGMATLIEALILEKEAAVKYGNKGPISLLNLTTGEAEQWIPVGFDKRNEEQQNWPEGWQRPWKVQPLIEVFDELGMLEENVSLQL